MAQTTQVLTREVVMLMPKFSGIYCLISPTGNKYIGQSKSVKNRLLKYLNRGIDKNQHGLKNSFNKHGITSHNFQILENTGKDVSNLNNLERYWVEKLNSFKCGLNCVLPKSDNQPCERSQEFISSISGVHHYNHSKEIITLNNYYTGQILKGTRLSLKEKVPTVYSLVVGITKVTKCGWYCDTIISKEQVKNHIERDKGNTRAVNTTQYRWKELCSGNYITASVYYMYTHYNISKRTLNRMVKNMKENIKYVNKSFKLVGEV